MGGLAGDLTGPWNKVDCMACCGSVAGVASRGTDAQTHSDCSDCSDSVSPSAKCPTAPRLLRFGALKLPGSPCACAILGHNGSHVKSAGSGTDSCWVSQTLQR